MKYKMFKKGGCRDVSCFQDSRGGKRRACRHLCTKERLEG